MPDIAWKAPLTIHVNMFLFDGAILKNTPFLLRSKRVSAWVSDQVPFDFLQKFKEWLRHPWAKKQTLESADSIDYMVSIRLNDQDVLTGLQVKRTVILFLHAAFRNDDIALSRQDTICRRGVMYLAI